MLEGLYAIGRGDDVFEKIRNGIRQVINKLFSKNDIKDATGVEVAISEEMSNAIGLWGAMYEDKAPWVDNNKIKSLNLSAAIASEMARLVTLEMESEITGGKRAEYLNSQYKKVIEDIRRVTEYACSKGGLIFKPYIDGDSIAVDYVQADLFFPTKYDSSGNITGCIFVERKRHGDVIYTRLEHHDLQDTGYYISNKAYKNAINDGTIGTRIPLTAVDEWKDLEPEVLLTNIDKPLFSYFKIPIANTIDTRSPLGVSVYARAVSLIEQADRQYSRTLWEYEGGELAINAAVDLFKANGEVPEGKERLFAMLDTDQEDFFEEWAPTLRDESFFNGLNKLLQRIEFNCGLAYGTLSDVQMVDKTATEVKASKQRTYSTVQDIQKSLEHALEGLVEAMDIWATLGKLSPVGDYDISFEWDDSLVMDAETENAQMYQEVAAGLIKPEYYLMKRYGVTEEQLKEMMPSMDEPMDEEDYDDLE